jgi:hypothetical protein
MPKRNTGGRVLQAKDCTNNLNQRKYYETPLYGHVRSDKQKGAQGTSNEKEEESLSVGEGEGVRRVGYGRSTITCNLAVATRHHRISNIPRIKIAVS